MTVCVEAEGQRTDRPTDCWRTSCVCSAGRYSRRVLEEEKRVHLSDAQKQHLLSSQSLQTEIASFDLTVTLHWIYQRSIQPSDIWIQNI